MACFWVHEPGLGGIFGAKGALWVLDVGEFDTRIVENRSGYVM